MDVTLRPPTEAGVPRLGRIHYEAFRAIEEPHGFWMILISVVLFSVVATTSLAQESRMKKGFEISPIPENGLNLKHKDRALVGLGSYLVNAAADCSGCHTYPQYLSTSGDPFTGGNPDSPEFNTTHYLAGGQCFGPFMARNITPDAASGLPDGLTRHEFITALRTGKDLECEKDPSDPICAVEPPTPLLQVMPWQTYHNLNDFDLKAIYEYLSALPSADPCNTPVDGCPGFSGIAKTSSSYVYPNTSDCPNPAPPQ